MTVPLHRFLPLRDSTTYLVNENGMQKDNCTDGIQWIERVSIRIRCKLLIDFWELLQR